MKKILFILALPLFAHAEAPPVLKHIFEITKTYHPHYRTSYEVRVNEKNCEFYTLDPLRIYWKNAKKNDETEELKNDEHDLLDPLFSVKTPQQIRFQVKSMIGYGIDYPITVDVVRTGDKCEVVASGTHHKVVKNVHVIIKWFRAKQLVISGTGLNGRDTAITFDIK